MLSNHCGLPRAHVYIAAMGRSGSTMLANLLTRPPGRWLLIEPLLPKGGKGKALHEQARRFGFDIPDEEWSHLPNETDASRIRRLFSERLSNLSRWGVKEVRGELHEATIQMIRPAKIIVLVRDIADVALSLHEKRERNPDPARDREWMRRYVIGAAGNIVLLHKNIASSTGSVKTVRYEDFVTNPDTRRQLEEWLDWPLAGEPTANLAMFEREYEIERHGNRITDTSVERRNRELSIEEARFAQEMSEKASEYQKYFGYVNGPAR